MSDFFKKYILIIADYIKSEYLPALILFGMINLPYILIKVFWENKIQTLFYIFFGLLVFVRIFSQNRADNENYKLYREKYPSKSKQEIVHLIAKKKTHRDGSFFLSLLVLIFSYLLV